MTDIFATSVDYDRTNDITRTFFATVQNKLHFAELQALEQKPMRMQDWVAKLDALLALSGRQLLTGNGSISHEEASRSFGRLRIAKFRGAIFGIIPT